MAELDMNRMLDAYMRRKKWEAKLLAYEVLLPLSKPKKSNGRTQEHEAERVSASKFFSVAGQKI